MSPVTLLFLSGWSAVLGGALRIAAAFVPWRPDSFALEGFYLVIDLLLLFGLGGVYLARAARLGAAGAVGFVAAFAGLASLVGPDPVAFGIDFYAAGSGVLALGLAAMAVSMASRRVYPLWIPALWIAVPATALLAAALQHGDAGTFLAGIAFGAGFVGAGRCLILESGRERRRPSGAMLGAGALMAAIAPLLPPAAAEAAEPGGSVMSTLQLDLNQVTLPARDLRQSIDYYIRFGLKLIVDSPESQYARFEVPGGDATLSIHVADGRVREPAPHLYFETADPEAIVAQLHERGIEPEAPLEAKPWLWREAWYVDPAGNRLCVYHAGENRKRPPWRVGD